MNFVIGALQWKLPRAPLPFHPALLAGHKNPRACSTDWSHWFKIKKQMYKCKKRCRKCRKKQLTCIEHACTVSTKLVILMSVTCHRCWRWITSRQRKQAKPPTRWYWADEKYTCLWQYSCCTVLTHDCFSWRSRKCECICWNLEMTEIKHVARIMPDLWITFFSRVEQTFTAVQSTMVQDHLEQHFLNMFGSRTPGTSY